MVLSPKEREIVERIAYDEQLITTNLKPNTLIKKVETLRPRLHDVANRREKRNYSEITDGYTIVHWSRVGTVLGIIGILEHELGNPLLPAVIVNENQGWPGEGFLGLLGAVGEQIPDSEAEQKELWKSHLNMVYNHDW